MSLHSLKLSKLCAGALLLLVIQTALFHIWIARHTVRGSAIVAVFVVRAQKRAKSCDGDCQNMWRSGTLELVSYIDSLSITVDALKKVYFHCNDDGVCSHSLSFLLFTLTKISWSLCTEFTSCCHSSQYLFLLGASKERYSISN